MSARTNDPSDKRITYNVHIRFGEVVVVESSGGYFVREDGLLVINGDPITLTSTEAGGESWGVGIQTFQTAPKFSAKTWDYIEILQPPATPVQQ